MNIKQRALSLLLSLAIVLTFMPALAFADDVSDDNPDSSQTREEQAAVDDSAEQPEEVPENAAEDAVDEGSLDLKAVAAGTPEPPAAGANSEAAELTAELSQAKIDYRDIAVTVKDLDKIVAADTADAVKIDASMSYGGNVTVSETKTISLKDFDTASNSTKFSLPYFGLYDVIVTFQKSGEAVGTATKSKLGVAAEEYNIVLSAATTDTLIFGLRYFIDGAVKKSTEAGDPVPTIVTLNRYKQYDWNNLPEDMYRDPLLTADENCSGMKWDYMHDDKNNKVDRMVEYVKELNSIHADSKFNFYINDYHIYSFPRLSYANGLEDDQYTLTMITDGSASYVGFKTAYEGAEDAQAIHDQRVSEYKEFKEKATAGTTTDYNNLPSGLIRTYAYAIVDAENANWWVVRKSTDTFGLTDTTFQGKLLSDARVTNSYINGLLSTVQGNGSEDKFKKLYKFEDDAFNATRAKGKKIMMVLGTAKSLEDKYPVTDYVRFMVTEMGDEYEFYYKGHPGNYTANSKENVKKYEEMGIQMLDPSIAAELFLFYNSDIYLCGYESSLFNNASNEKSEEQDVALFRRTLQTAKADPALTAYVDFMDFAISDMTDTEDNFTYTYDEEWDAARPGMAAAKAESIEIRDKVKALVPSEETADKNYLVQYNNTESKTVSKYDYAIWNSDKGLIHYIKANEDGSLSIVESKETGDTEKPEESNEPKVGTTAKIGGSTYKVTSAAKKTVEFTKAKNAKSVKVANTVKINNYTYKVTSIGANAFKGKKIRTVTIGKNVKKIKKNAFKKSKATKLIVKSKLLTKKSVKGSLKGSKIKTVQVKVGNKTANRKHVKKYKKYFTKKNAGRKASVR